MGMHSGVWYRSVLALSAFWWSWLIKIKQLHGSDEKMPYSRWSGWWAWVPIVQWIPCLIAKSQPCHIPNVLVESIPLPSLALISGKLTPADGVCQASRVWLRGSTGKRLKSGKKWEARVSLFSSLPHGTSAQLLHFLYHFILASIISEHGGLPFIICQSQELAFLYVKAHTNWCEKNNHRN